MFSPRFFLWLGVAAGSLLTCAPLLGFAGAMLRMLQASGTLGDAGISDPRLLSRAVGETLLMTAGGLFLFPFGIALLVICLSLLKRERGSQPPPLPRFPENFGDPEN